MPTISSLRVHTRAVMARALSCAGQYAHADIDSINLVLDRIYDEGVRLRSVVESGEDEYADAAHPFFVKSYLSGHTPQLYDALGTIVILNLTIGSLCSLCFEITTYYGHRAPFGMSRFLMPTFLQVVPERKDGRTHTSGVCRYCADGIWRTAKNYGFLRGDGMTRDEQALAVAELLGKQWFKKRVRKNARTELRFDPRVIQKALEVAE